MSEKCELCEQSEDEKCILHCEKDDWYVFKTNPHYSNRLKDWSKSKEKRKEFWNLFYESYNDSASLIVNILFPPLIDEREDELFLNDSIILDGLKVEKSTGLFMLNSEIRGDIVSKNIKLYFDETIHKGNIIIYHTPNNDIYLKNIKIANIYFGGMNKDSIEQEFNNIEIIGNKTDIKNLKLTNSIVNKKLKLNNILIENFNCLNTVFKEKVEIKNSTLKEDISFENAKFEALCDFYQTYFYKVKFEKTTFKDVTVFTESIFNENIDFKYTTFEELVLFRKTIFHKKLNLIDSIIKEEANFLGIKNRDEENLKPSNIENRETARIIKYSFEKQANIIESNKFYALEMDKEREELEFKINPTQWLIFTIHNISSNHSQDIKLPILWILSISFFYIGFLQINDSLYNKGEIIAYHISNVIIFFGLIFKIHIVSKYLYLIFIQILFLHLISLCSIDRIFNAVADKVNPFSIMTSVDSLTFDLLIFKMIIAYLIYQFIISIRQNTRRQ